MVKLGFKILIILTLVSFFFAYDFSEFVEVLPREKVSSEKGIYITYYVAKTPKRFNYLVSQAKSSGINTLVIDAKAALSPPLLKLIKEKKLTKNTVVAPNPWLAKLSKDLHKQGFIVTVRLVVFKDDHLVIARPDLGIRRKDGSLYRDHKWGRWADPYSAEVRLYNELIAESAALSGVDEVQFDYIRFPAEAGAGAAVYSHEDKNLTKVDIIESYLAAVRKRLKKYKTSIGIDVFGVIAWQDPKDINALGQDLKRMAKHIDVVSPMLYPSHFHAGYDGFDNPGSYPYYFMYTGLKKTQEILSQEAVTIVPWLQAFNLRSPNYSPQYILDQVQACNDLGINNFLLWNARNVYEVPAQALKKGYN